MRSSEMRKKRRLRSVCAPHSRSAGTSIGPKLSFSVRLPLIASPMLLLGRDSGEVEQQYFGPLAFFENDARGVCLQSVAGIQHVAVHRNPAARHVNIGAAALRHCMLGALRAVEYPRGHARGLMYRDPAL